MKLKCLEELASTTREAYKVYIAGQTPAGSVGAIISGRDLYAAMTDVKKHIEALDKAIEHIDALNE